MNAITKTIIIVLCAISSISYAHNAHNTNNKSKKWVFNGQQKTIKGSFYMYKNSEVYIEDEQGTIVHFPLACLSNSDKTFVLKKAEWIKAINNKIHTHNALVAIPKTSANFKFYLLLSFLLLLGGLTYSYANKPEFKYLASLFSFGIVLFCYSFTKQAMQFSHIATSTTFLDSAFAPFKPAVNTYSSGAYFYVESKGIPTTHNMMVGIGSNGWQQQVPIPQCYIGTNAWPIPLTPVVATTPVPVNASHFSRGAIAIAANGVAIFNPYTNTGVDAFLDGQLDNYGGHCGRADDYHYHIAPMFLDSITADVLPIAFALDGFAIYASKEPNGTAMLTLDVNHGHYLNGVYHYHGTALAPYMIGSMVGQITEDATKQIIPQAQASPVRPGQNPLPGATITSCLPNANNDGYTLKYTLNNQLYIVDYNWTTAGVYTFNFTAPSGTVTTNNYNGFMQCTVPNAINNYTLDNTNLSIYPNPTSNFFGIKLNTLIKVTDVKQIAIYNMKGDMVYTQNYYTQNIDIKQLTQGTYIVKISLPKTQVTKKLIIQ